MSECVYVQNGYDDRKDYLSCMADDYGVEFTVVEEIANLLGENEDFDGLVSMLDDISDSMFDWDVNERYSSIWKWNTFLEK